MRDLGDLPKDKIRAVFSDLDGTLTDNSKISTKTYESLFHLKESGFHLVVVSGRPAGWADCLMRLWPLDAMIFENGAGLVLRERETIRTQLLAENKTIEEQHAILKKIFGLIQQKVPSARLAQDSRYRLFDYAIDYAEEPPFLSEDKVKWILGFLNEVPEITVKVSSIHINYWFGKHTKVTGCQYWFSHVGASRGITLENSVFCGDSPNDEPLFDFFPHSIGVSNIHKFLGQMKNHPRYVTDAPAGRGFVEVATKLLTKSKL